MNVVCLTGRVAAAPMSPRGTRPAPAGWSSLVIEAPRQTAFGDDEPGVIQVMLTLSPKLTDGAATTLRPGRAVAVVGILDVEVDHSDGRPRAYHSVIAQRIEAVADPLAVEF